MKKTSKALLTKNCLSILLIINFFSLTSITANSIDFEEIIEELDNLTNVQAYSRLFNYQTENPHAAHVYVQLGKTSEKILKELDPLREFERSIYWANNAILYYDLFPVYLGSNEVRRNRDFYSNVPVEPSGRRLNNVDIKKYIEERTEYCNSYKDSLTLIFESIEKSKDNYNNCVRMFNNINEKYNNLNEALLKTDEDFIAKLNELQQEFNLAIKEFDVYKSLLNQFPVGDYNQTYKLRPIITFRLEGLTNSDFLKDTFHIWDYGQWVDQYINTYEEEIVPLRNEIEDIQIQFDENLQFLLEVNSVDSEMALQSYDELFFFRLGKYDNNSLIRELFYYLDERQDYLFMGKDPINNPSDSSYAAMNRKLRYYHRLSNKLKDSEKELFNFHNAITSEKISRFEDYFNEYYHGEQGLNSFYSEQVDFLYLSFETGLDNLKTYFKNEKHKRKSLDTVILDINDSILIYPKKKHYEKFKQQKYITNKVVYLQGQPVYIAGHINGENESNPFVAKISNELEVEWLKEITVENEDENLSNKTTKKLYGYENGVAAIVSAYIKPGIPDEEIDKENEEQNDDNGSNEELDEGFDEELDEGFDEGFDEEDAYNDDSEKILKNTLVHIDNEGEIIFKKTLDNNNHPIFLKYDDLNQHNYMAFGTKEDDNSQAYTDISISQADSAGIKFWETTMEVKGNLADIVRAEDKFIAYLNFQHYDIKGDRRITGNRGDDWAYFIADISFDGDIINTTPVIANQSFFINRVFSISTDEINLLGYTGKPFDKSGNLKYFIVSDDGDILFDNFR